MCSGEVKGDGEQKNSYLKSQTRLLLNIEVDTGWRFASFVLRNFIKEQFLALPSDSS